jgi:hypothetical protein
MYVGTQTKNLARSVFLFSASSLCAIILCAAATHRHNAVASRSVSVPIYFYQNPFGMTASVSSPALLKTKAGGLLTRLVSAKWFLGLSGLATLWAASSWYLSRGWAKRRQNHRKTRHVITDIPAMMNPLAAIPRPILRVSKKDDTRPAVLGQTGTRGLFIHRKATAPCQSRFRPVTLVSSQTRLGRLK